MSENKIAFNVYEIVPELASKFIGQHDLLAVIFGGSYASHNFRSGSDVDVDLLFRQLRSGHATTIAHAMTYAFKGRGLILDIRTCVDLAGDAIFLHKKGGLLRHPTEGTVNISNLYNNNHIVFPPTFDLRQL